MGSSRAPPPPPLTINKNRSSSYSSDASSAEMDSPHVHSAKDTSGQASSPKRRACSSPTVNRYTTCGRHTDQYLFGGRSLTEMARSVMKRD